MNICTAYFKNYFFQKLVNKSGVTADVKKNRCTILKRWRFHIFLSNYSIVSSNIFINRRIVCVVNVLYNNI